jgi:predicted GTPase
MSNVHFTDEVVKSVETDPSIDEVSRVAILKNLARLKDTKVNILITGATGCGKSSTINALFNADKAKVGQGSDPETMTIAKYELDNIVLFDSPGLGDGKEADIRHAKNIMDKLYEKDAQGNILIDLVLVILDGSSRDLGTSFELINTVIIPNLGDDQSRLLIAINQADVAMKGKHWNHTENRPEPTLEKFLDDKVESVQRRIKEATGVDIKPIYYSAGYKEGNEAQNPYNLSKLLVFILRHTKAEKRAVFVQDINKNEEMWKSDDRKENYRKEIKESFMDSLVGSMEKGASIGRDIGNLVGLGGVGAFVGGAVGAVSSVFSSVFSSWW